MSDWTFELGKYAVQATVLVLTFDVLWIMFRRVSK